VQCQHALTCYAAVGCSCPSSHTVRADSGSATFMRGSDLSLPSLAVKDPFFGGADSLPSKDPFSGGSDSSPLPTLLPDFGGKQADTDRSRDPFDSSDSDNAEPGPSAFPKRQFKVRSPLHCCCQVCIWSNDIRHPEVSPHDLRGGHNGAEYVPLPSLTITSRSYDAFIGKIWQSREQLLTNIISRLCRS
jgi:hypothetical protein